MKPRSHRSFISYIDRSRAYYAAQGYEEPYRWATHDDAPFARPAQPLEECRVGVVTTAYFPAGHEPEGVPTGPEKQPYAAPTALASGCVHTDDLSWAKEETHTDDLDTYLPVHRLAEAEADGLIGSISPRFYGIPTRYSHRRSSTEDAPEVARWMHEDQVDVAILVPL